MAKKEINNTGNTLDLNRLLDAQEEFLVYKYNDKDILISENKRLNNEVNRLSRRVDISNYYIDYLLKSKWWKITMPFRKILRFIRNNKNKTINYNFKCENYDDCDNIDELVSVIIYTYNAGEEFKLLLENIRKQKKINNIEIIVVDNGSVDNTLEYAKKYKCNIYISDKSNVDYYLLNKSVSKGKFIVKIDQQTSFDSGTWIYDGIRPLRDNKASCSIIYSNKEKFLDEMVLYYQELKDRLIDIDMHSFLFLPYNRDKIEYICPAFLDNNCAMIKKNE